MPEFTHLHVHTQYSILDGFSDIKKLVKKTKELGMKSLAITDHGNMYGVFTFFTEAKKQGLKPIIGCEVYVAHNSISEKTKKDDRSGYHLILLAKNVEGYQNLSKLVSYGFIDGFYYTPRIDKELLKKYSKGLIASSACLGGELAKTIMNEGAAKAECVINEFKEIFHDDYYMEMMNHGYPEQHAVNKTIAELSAKTGVKYIATNDLHFINAADYEAHTILICLNTGKDINDTEGMHYTGQEYLKSPEDMAKLFPEYPEALSTTQEIVDKIEDYNLNKDPILPKFPLPEGFDDENTYLEYLTYEGAKKLYPNMDEETMERIDFELATVKRMGFPGYFLIVQDFINESRKMGVRVGPGRGSAAGSAVAYCLRITTIDPLKYNLLFERFLNPERISMPDVDVDFDDVGRDKVINYVIQKYGKEKVAQIITFGSMAAKSSIKDVARVLKLPLQDAERLTKLIPERASNLAEAFKGSAELNEARNNGDELTRKTLRLAEALEGSVRNTGTHACGIIIGPEDLTNFAPLSTAKDTDMPVIQFEGSLVESAGLLKMDFLGLKTLTIINDALKNIKYSRGVDIDIDNVSLEDAETYELFSRGDTVGIFQFESDGMQKYLQDLKPNRLDDLIAMNALYRPGPMEYITNYVNRKHGREPITYAYPAMEKYLSDTYGITVYQEQVMLLSQTLAGFSKGQADTLRKAMGKKQIEVMNKLKDAFEKGCVENGYELEIVKKIWNDWEAFAQYAFNKSHSTCYAYLAYQTGYLKAHYPAEFLASVLTHNLSDIEKVTFFLDECKRSGIQVLGPDVNESQWNFSVPKDNVIRFGLGAVKGLGEAPVEAIVNEREENGPYRSIFDFIKRVSLKNISKRVLEALAMSGAFDCFPEIHRAVFFALDGEVPFTEKLIRYANNLNEAENAGQHSLFDDPGLAIDQQITTDPEIPRVTPWSSIEQLKKEKEIAGFYLSGHPLNDFKIEIDNFCNISIPTLKQDLRPLKGRELKFAGIVSAVSHRTTKTGNPMGSFNIEGYDDTIQIVLFSEDYLKFRYFLTEGTLLYIKATVKNKYNNEDLFELKINGISLLAEVIEKYTNRITMNVPLYEVNEKLNNKLKTNIQKHKGKCSLRLNVYDSNEKLNVRMLTRNIFVDASTFLKAFEYEHNISFKLD